MALVQDYAMSISMVAHNHTCLCLSSDSWYYWSSNLALHRRLLNLWCCSLQPTPLIVEPVALLLTLAPLAIGLAHMPLAPALLLLTFLLTDS
ncbi:hypothetical protein GMOD_00002635 [Pyrenophora seminiperda CCB06]|uniref:Uncharacterized protein n=1 Tax=Pyrenophora seminiperda CCB06 TaxID=1302712 RepID=A0A3M7M2N6_9PLEO|nr:hypothetical protein GMOD_00002635 [Pyrenophora seminiperda CCB06]